MNFRELMQLVLRGSFVDVTSEFFRRGGGGFVAGELHGGIDFRYVNNSLNGFGTAQVYSPISGTVVSVNGTSDGNDPANGWGWVVIQSDTDDTFHRFLHMHSVGATIQQGTHVDAGTVLGTMGGRGQYKKVRLVEGGPLVSINYLGQEV